MKRILTTWLVAAGLLVTPAAAGTNIDAGNRYGWAENVGWNDWHGDGVSSGAIVGATLLSGSVWFENTGWLDLGNGAPANGVHYSNASSSDFGVNVDAVGNLYGLAWGENVGWVNFDTSAAGSDRARLDYCSRLRGFAWGENVGWINLDDATRFVGIDQTAPAPSGTPVLTVTTGGGGMLIWTLLPGATAYDLVRGDMGTLHATDGDFTAATTNCLGNNLMGANTLVDAAVPASGQGFWYLTRGVSCGGSGTYDELSLSQVAPRDAKINASMLSCP